ncbi:TetR/AcrR family transcriptional regulator [Methylobacter sp. YRD-M1]|uniref:TetR/AcrR family transcriptional regulator n=1 Tax=Methylobacter sp. YRD-M1 TaxID=2911520 RepID=UPI00227C903A|nr:TetR/AcrR family transcriptional regulator [Methylobacter sp. YRD-M1]WAK01012.1 TetR/AcrR family transcriptional regulator [Methylobacter sp. YRD-M1]
MQSNTNQDRQSLPARERILLAAHDLFYKEGIRATGIDRIIAEAGVTKVTFYRHFPSKNDLICAFLEYRHQLWMAWFTDALQRHGGDLKALIPTLAEWFRNGSFRGCAFLNGVGELGGTLPAVVEITRSHKQDMTRAISDLLPPSRICEQYAQAISVAVDGAIVRAQFDETPDAALESLSLVLNLLEKSL